MTFDYEDRRDTMARRLRAARDLGCLACESDADDTPFAWTSHPFTSSKPPRRIRRLRLIRRALAPSAAACLLIASFAAGWLLWR